MPVPQFATAADLTEWMAPRPAPANPDPLLRHASRIVAHAVRVRVAVEGGVVVDAGQKEALRDATTAQAESMADSYGAGGDTEQSVDGVILNSDPVGGTSFSSLPLANEARRILNGAGLIPPVVSVR